MKNRELIRCDGPFEVYRVSEARTTEVDARTFRALCRLERIRRRWGTVIAVLAAIPLAIWYDITA